MAQATFTDDVDGTDAVDRPVEYNGFYCVVLAAHGGAEVTIQHWRTIEVRRSGEFVGEPIRVSLLDCIPLCIDCGEPLEESEDEWPGTCHNVGQCFLAGPRE